MEKVIACLILLILSVGQDPEKLEQIKKTCFTSQLMSFHNRKSKCITVLILYRCGTLNVIHPHLILSIKPVRNYILSDRNVSCSGK